MVNGHRAGNLWETVLAPVSLQSSMQSLNLMGIFSFFGAELTNMTGSAS